MNLLPVHDKLAEASFFLRHLTQEQGKTTLQRPEDAFRFYLSAFLNAAYSAREYLERSAKDKLKEAAETDGASPWQVFRNVTLPALRPVLFVAIVLRFMDAFRKFEGIQVLTTGGPGNSSTPLNLHIYNTGLFYHQVGYAAAYGVVMIALIGISVGLMYLAVGRSR